MDSDHPPPPLLPDTLEASASLSIGLPAPSYFEIDPDRHNLGITAPPRALRVVNRSRADTVDSQTTEASTSESAGTSPTLRTTSRSRASTVDSDATVVDMPVPSEVSLGVLDKPDMDDSNALFITEEEYEKTLAGMARKALDDLQGPSAVLGRHNTFRTSGNILPTAADMLNIGITNAEDNKFPALPESAATREGQGGYRAEMAAYAARYEASELQRTRTNGGRHNTTGSLRSTASTAEFLELYPNWKQPSLDRMGSTTTVSTSFGEFNNPAPRLDRMSSTSSAISKINQRIERVGQADYDREMARTYSRRATGGAPQYRGSFRRNDTATSETPMLLSAASFGQSSPPKSSVPSMQGRKLTGESITSSKPVARSATMAGRCRGSSRLNAEFNAPSFDNRSNLAPLDTAKPETPMMSSSAAFGHNAPLPSYQPSERRRKMTDYEMAQALGSSFGSSRFDKYPSLNNESFEMPSLNLSRTDTANSSTPLVDINKPLPSLTPQKMLQHKQSQRVKKTVSKKGKPLIEDYYPDPRFTDEPFALFGAAASSPAPAVRTAAKETDTKESGAKESRKRSDTAGRLYNTVALLAEWGAPTPPPKPTPVNDLVRDKHPNLKKREPITESRNVSGFGSGLPAFKSRDESTRKRSETINKSLFTSAADFGHNSPPTFSARRDITPKIRFRKTARLFNESDDDDASYSHTPRRETFEDPLSSPFTVPQSFLGDEAADMGHRNRLRTEFKEAMGEAFNEIKDEIEDIGQDKSKSKAKKSKKSKNKDTYGNHIRRPIGYTAKGSVYSSDEWESDEDDKDSDRGRSMTVSDDEKDYKSDPNKKKSKKFKKTKKNKNRNRSDSVSRFNRICDRITRRNRLEAETSRRQQAEMQANNPGHLARFTAARTPSEWEGQNPYRNGLNVFAEASDLEAGSMLWTRTARTWGSDVYWAFQLRKQRFVEKYFLLVWVWFEFILINPVFWIVLISWLFQVQYADYERPVVEIVEG